MVDLAWPNLLVLDWCCSVRLGVGLDALAWDWFNLVRIVLHGLMWLDSNSDLLGWLGWDVLSLFKFGCLACVYLWLAWVDFTCILGSD